jgi:amino-acid N-acetyltransferase
MSMAIEAARPADLPVVLALLASAALPTDGVEEHFGGFVVAREGGEVIGAAGLEVHGNAALLRSVVVDPAWRKRRLGEALVRAMLAAAHRRRIGTIYLLTESAADFFARFGFERIAQADIDPAVVAGSAEFRIPRCESAARMRRHVPQEAQS